MNIDIQLQKKVEQLGLSDKAAKIYLYLLEAGGDYPSTIAKEIHISRSTVYRILTELSVQGLIVEIEKEKKQFYQIEPPESLLRFTEMKEELAKGQVKQAKQVFPDIEELYNSLPHKPKIRYFEGLKNIEKILDDQVSQAGEYEIMGWGNITALQMQLRDGVLERYFKKADERPIKTRVILAETEEESVFWQDLYKKINITYRIEKKMISKDQFPYDCELGIYGENKVSIINAHPENPNGIIIEDKILYGMIKMVFDFFWDNLPE
ncbi:helix-turn-helix domain-containing protein [Patescibacteria group bacterium]|nr:helix-turn-helix domain-containing protein [Patescibacteria group bacterium]MBU1721823.1 helix-turn-helix domain-containing protein [Patescibacteria group bacterium]MBU1901682.1 helix-turn-helix domain-containing protein [Patescibacteria group bacterium]